jgi:hypothetical protein
MQKSPDAHHWPVWQPLQAALHTARPWQSANEQRSSVHLQRSASPPPLALLQRARMVAYARTPDAAPCGAVRRALSMHVLGTVAQRSPGLPVGPHPLHSPRLRRLACLSARQSARMAHDGRLQAPARTWWHARTQQQHRARCGRPCPCKACTNSLCSVRPARNGRLQPAYRPCSSPPLHRVARVERGPSCDLTVVNAV